MRDTFKNEAAVGRFLEQVDRHIKYDNYFLFRNKKGPRKGLIVMNRFDDKDGNLIIGTVVVGGRKCEGIDLCRPVQIRMGISNMDSVAHDVQGAMHELDLIANQRYYCPWSPPDEPAENARHFMFYQICDKVKRGLR